MDTSHIKRKWLNLPYALLSPAQKLDIYIPEKGDGPFPVILQIHGGAFREGDKADEQTRPMMSGLDHGYAVVAVNYRMSGEAIFPSLVHDIKAAIRWVRAHAAQYHLNPKKIAAWGGSAGGWQSAMAGLTEGVGSLEDLSLGNPEQPCGIQAVVDWFGPTDFLKMDEQVAESGLVPIFGEYHNSADSPESMLLGKQITLVPELVKAANPETYITPQAPPFLIQHGTLDAVVPVQQSIHLAEKLAAVIGKEKVILDLLEGAQHADPRFDTPGNVHRVLEFLDRHLK
jgi:acetyl esterase/lipase